jgi:ABC-2 type transport system ATP-binding protein
MEAVKVVNVSKKFKADRKAHIHALKNVSLEIEEGEIFGILGPNGAGKTTLLNVMTGLLIPDSGYVKIFGKTLQEDRTVLEKINYVSGESRFHWNLTPKNILNFYGMLYNVPRTERKRRMNHLIDIFEVGPFVNQRFGHMSSGQRMRTVLAKSLINNPKLLLLDEPTLGLDPDIALKVRKLIASINKERKTTIILTSHYMSEVEQLCKRIAFIHQGKVVDVGEVEKVKLKKFAVYDVMIELRRIKKPDLLRKMGFKIQGNRLFIPLDQDKSISELLSKLVSKGYHITDLEIKKPSLEDYFIKMLK